MKFEREKVVDCLSDNLEQWIDWEGYCSDMILYLMNYVEKDDTNKNFYKVCKIQRNTATPFHTERYKYQFFYPVSPPKEKAEKELAENTWTVNI